MLNEDLDADSQVLTYIFSSNTRSIACIDWLKGTGAVLLAEMALANTWQWRVGCSSSTAGTRRG